MSAFQGVPAGCQTAPESIHVWPGSKRVPDLGETRYTLHNLSPLDFSSL
jgi:hypothetical protein